MNNKLNVGVIGCGSIFTTHAEVIKDLENVNLVCVCDPDESKAVKASEKYNCKYYLNYNEMIKNEKLDIIHICTPHYLHSQMAIDSLSAGINVLTEKPMATNLQDAEEMVKVSEKNEKQLGVCFQNRYNNSTKKIKELLENNKLGKIKGGKVFITWARNEGYYSTWRGKWATEGGGLLINQAIHSLDLLYYFFGDIVEIDFTCFNSKFKNTIEVEDTASGILKFENVDINFFGTLCYTEDSPVQMELIFENGKIVLSDELKVYYQNGEIERVSDAKNSEKSYWGSSHGDLIRDFYDCISNDRHFWIDGHEAVNALEIVLMCYKNFR